MPPFARLLLSGAIEARERRRPGYQIAYLVRFLLRWWLLLVILLLLIEYAVNHLRSWA